MRFGLLGSLEVVQDGRPLDLGRPKQRALLAVLLLDANRVVSLDRLIDLLWGDEPPARSTGSLQVYVSNLRRILEPGRSPRTPARVLVTEPPGYLLRIDPDDLDATRFEMLAAEGARLLAGGRPEAAVGALDAALELWRGPALAEFAYEDFARSAATRWDELRAAAREDRMEAEVALGGHLRAAAELEAMVKEAPLRERRWALLMLALYRCGRQADALRAYGRARRTLADELGVDPGPALARMEADVLAHAPHLLGRMPDAIAATTPGPGPPSAATGAEAAGAGVSGAGVAGAGAAGAGAAPAGARRRGGTGLVGRQEQLRAMDAVLDDVLAGRARVLLVSGEAGIGKSRLLEEFATTAGDRGALVAWGRAFEGGVAPAFWPWVQVLRALAAEADDDALRQAAGAGAGAVAQLVPELAARWGGSAPGPLGDAETARFRLYEAVTAMLRLASGRRPVVVLLDDLHWSDAASLGMTEFVAAQPALGGVLLVASYRPEDIGSDHQVMATLGALARLPALERLELAGLSPPEVARFVADAAGVEPSNELVTALHARTEGNPFFLGELVRLLAAERSLTTPAAVTETAIPAGVRDVVRRRLARLPEPSNDLLRLAAVVGREFDLTLLAVAARIDEEEALRSIEAALLIGVVVEGPTSVGCYRFAHALVRDSLYEQLSALRRARLHGQVGRALQGRVRGDDRLDELAHHLFQAAPADGPDAAFAYVMRAAGSAQDRLAYEDAEDQLRRALQLVERMPSGPERADREIDVQLRLAGLVSMVRSWAVPEAGRAWGRVAELCREFGHADRLLTALSGQWIFAIMKGDYGAACAARDRIADFSRSTGDPTSIMLREYQSGYLALHRAELAAARTHLDAAIERVRALDGAALVQVFHLYPESLFLAISAMVLWLLGDDEARARMDASMAVARRSEHPFTLAIGFVNASVIDAWALDAVALRAVVEPGIAMTAEYGLHVDEAHLHAMRGWARAVLGEPEAGVAEAEQALDEIKTVGRVMSRSWLLGLLADARRVAGRLDGALAAVDEAVDVMHASGERHWAAELYRLRGELLLERWPDRRDDALSWLRRAVEVAAEQGAAPLHRRAEESLARAQMFETPAG